MFPVRPAVAAEEPRLRDRREQIDGGRNEPTIVFPNLAQADRAQEKLRHAGCGEEDVISVSGEEVVHFAQDHWLQDGLWGFLMRRLSRLLGTEEPTRIRTWRRGRMARHSLPCTVPPRRSKLTREDCLRRFTPW